MAPDTPNRLDPAESDDSRALRFYEALLDIAAEHQVAAGDLLAVFGFEHGRPTGGAPAAGRSPLEHEGRRARLLERSPASAGIARRPGAEAH